MTTVPTAGDEEKLVAALRRRLESVWDGGSQDPCWQDDALCQVAADTITRLRQERDEAINWTETVERHGTDGFDDLAEAWLALPAIQRTTNAAISTFARWANDDLMARFKKNQLSMFHLAFVEGCLAGVRAEAALSASNAEAERLREALRQILRCEYDGPGLRDCTDNDGVPYQSADLAKHIAAAEELVGARALQGSAKQ